MTNCEPTRPSVLSDASAEHRRDSLTWKAFWDSFNGCESVAQAESEDFVQRLGRLGLLNRDTRVLDFGCGFGFIAGMVSEHARQVAIWDATPRLLEQARQRLQTRPGISVIDLHDPAKDPIASFDLIIVNSVIQYMTETELVRWLERWSSMLAPRGRLLISDVPVSVDLRRDILDVIWFSARRHLLFHSARLAWREFHRLWAAKAVQPLLRLSPAVWQSHSHAAGLTLHRLPENLTLRRTRMSLIFCHKEENTTSS